MNETPSRAALFADRFNPIVVKELRQSMKSKMFSAWFLITLTIGAGVALLGAYSVEESTDPEIGMTFFMVFVFFLNAIAIALIPMTAYFGLSLERDDRTLELVNISGLSPEKIARGKLISTLVQAGIYISAILPFFAFCYFLRGIDVLSIAFILILQLLTCALATTMAIALAAMLPSRPARLIVGGILTMGLLALSGMGTGLAWIVIEEQVAQQIIDNFTKDGIAQAVIGCLYGYLSIFALFYAIAVGRLSFESANRSAPVRLAILALLLGWVALFTWVFFDLGREPMLATGLFSIFTAIWMIVGFFIPSDCGAVSRRTWKSLERRSKETRALMSFLMPGPERGMLFFLAGLGLALGLTVVLLKFFTAPPVPGTFTITSSEEVFSGVILSASYIALYIATPWILALLAGAKRALHFRVATLIFVAFSLMIPLIGLLLIGPGNSGSPIFWLTNPIGFTQEVYANNEVDWTMVSILAVVAGIVAAAAATLSLRRFLVKGPEQVRA